MVYAVDIASCATERVTIAHVSHDNRKPLSGAALRLKPLEVALDTTPRDIVVEHDAMPVLEKTVDEIGPNETRAARYQHSHCHSLLWREGTASGAGMHPRASSCHRRKDTGEWLSRC